MAAWCWDCSLWRAWWRLGASSDGALPRALHAGAAAQPHHASSWVASSLGPSMLDPVIEASTTTKWMIGMAGGGICGTVPHPASAGLQDLAHLGGKLGVKTGCSNYGEPVGPECITNGPGLSLEL